MKTTKSEDHAQGANSSPTGVPAGTIEGDIPTVEQVTGWLKADLSRAIQCLDALYTDADLLAHCAAFMQGRLVNHRNAQKAKQEAK